MDAKISLLDSSGGTTTSPEGANPPAPPEITPPSLPKSNFEILKNISTIERGINPGYWIFNDIIRCNDNIYFVGSDGNTGDGLWRTDGTDVGTQLIKTLTNTAGAIGYTPFLFGSNIFIPLNEGADLGISDGSPGGTTVLKSNLMNLDFLETKPLVPGYFLFAADDGIHGTEPWRSDGTTSGTFLLKDLVTAGDSFFFGKAVSIGTVTFFVAQSDTEFAGLWKTDGTPAGTMMVKDIIPGSVDFVNDLTLL